METATTGTAITTTTTETTKAAVTKKRKSVFTKVDQLKPGTGGHTLTVKVVSSKTVLQNGRLVLQHLRHTRIAECLVGDETRAIIFTARNDQVDMIKLGATVILHKAKIDMFKGSMRLAVDKWGRVEVTKDANFVVKEQNNLLLVEYELVVESIINCLNISSDPATFIQGAFPEILEKTKEDFFSNTIIILRECADIIHERIKDIPCITCPQKPEGSMFVMVKGERKHDIFCTSEY
ncbi:hypothetical protein VitviT2T_028445 [Vitis vinifera]|uniref:Single-stranded DNA binding protein Ssb-like OB fold domain-containing protein n=1 Tax=Vitis vinifera TaxID=29760 RepID=A0ABY9DT51_VITVI|nr:hypothetical protein VitviT2T_028445 [Vitis vinifera]